MNETSEERKHRYLVRDLMKDPNEILDHTGGHNMALMHAALGIAGEAGEVVDLIKKITINGRPTDMADIMEELGDLEFYLSMLRSQLHIDRQVVLQMNIEKLRKRYPNGYSDQAALRREDLG